VTHPPIASFLWEKDRSVNQNWRSAKGRHSPNGHVLWNRMGLSTDDQTDCAGYATGMRTGPSDSRCNDVNARFVLISA
jgi:hypothetical protein